VSARPAPFPLVPRWRVAGTPFGEQRSHRRGPGSDIAGSRTYQPNDPVSAIDWRASARLSAARGADEFVVRQFYADEAPRVVVLCDRRPSMSLYPGDLPWLSKPEATAAIADLIALSAVAARGEVGYLDFAGTAPFWLPPRGRSARSDIEARIAQRAFDAEPDSLANALDHLARLRSDVPSGSFVFVVSDFVRPVPAELWLRALSLRWDVVPVVVQDPTWEQSFPEVHSVVVPFADASGGRVSLVRLSRGDARELRTAHEARLRGLLRELRSLGLDPVVVGTSDVPSIAREFLMWAELRRQSRRRSR
jgi:uncharacterized protein (DUF58 family)